MGRDAVKQGGAEKLEGMNDLNALVRAVTAEAYELGDKRGRLPERIVVEAGFDMDHTGRLALHRSRRLPGMVNLRMELAPQAAPPGLRLIADYAASEATRGRKKNKQKRLNRAVLYRRQGGYCAGCKHHFQLRNLTIDHIVPRSKGGSHDIANFQLLCHACNQLKGDGSQAQLVAELRSRGHVNRSLYGADD